MPLNVKKVENLRKPGRDGDGHGVYLNITAAPGLAKSWIFRYERDGRELWMGLGPTHVVTLAEARDLARDARKLLLGGTDPITHRDEERLARKRAAVTKIT